MLFGSIIKRTRVSRKYDYSLREDLFMSFKNDFIDSVMMMITLITPPLVGR